MRLHLTAAVKKFPSPDAVCSPWHEIFLSSWKLSDQPHGDKTIKADYGAFQVKNSWQLMKKPEEIKVKSAIVGVGAVESSFLAQCQFVEINKYDHEDIAPLMVSEAFTSLKILVRRRTLNRESHL